MWRMIRRGEDSRIGNVGAVEACFQGGGGSYCFVVSIVVSPSLPLPLLCLASSILLCFVQDFYTQYRCLVTMMEGKVKKAVFTLGVKDKKEASHMCRVSGETHMGVAFGGLIHVCSLSLSVCWESKVNAVVVRFVWVVEVCRRSFGRGWS